MMVGRGGLEPPTSRLSGVRSNHLSYRPKLICNANRRGPAGVCKANAKRAIQRRLPVIAGNHPPRCAAPGACVVRLPCKPESHLLKRYEDGLAICPEGLCSN